MPYTNIKNVTSQFDGQSIRLSIELDVNTDAEFVAAYQKALSENGSFTSWRSSGAPTVNDVVFSGRYVTTKSFPEFAKDDAKTFLKEFDAYLSIAKRNYDYLQMRKKQAFDQQIKDAEAQKKKLNGLNDFFNND